MSDDRKESYKVGYKNPPKDRQYKKGQSGNLAGRPPKEPINVAGLLAEPIRIMKQGKEVKLDPREVSLISSAKNGLKGNLRSLIYVLKQFEKYGAISFPEAVQNSGVFEFPAGLPSSLAMRLLKKEGWPPWPAKAIAKHKPAYLAARSAEEKAFDTFIGFE